MGQDHAREQAHASLDPDRIGQMAGRMGGTSPVSRTLPPRPHHMAGFARAQNRSLHRRGDREAACRTLRRAGDPHGSPHLERQGRRAPRADFHPWKTQNFFRRAGLAEMGRKRTRPGGDPDSGGDGVRNRRACDDRDVSADALRFAREPSRRIPCGRSRLRVGHSGDRGGEAGGIAGRGHRQRPVRRAHRQGERAREPLREGSRGPRKLAGFSRPRSARCRAGQSLQRLAGRLGGGDRTGVAPRWDVDFFRCAGAAVRRGGCRVGGSGLGGGTPGRAGKVVRRDSGEVGSYFARCSVKPDSRSLASGRKRISSGVRISKK